MKLYVKPKSKAFDTATQLLRTYGIQLTLHDDNRGSYFDVRPPAHWNDYRRSRFKAAIEQLDWA